ncbi:MAG: putative periplasmic protein, partial [Labilithrix sp.]|nr:putative periplasmic protein [Labilithrix sp.]
MRRSSSFLLLLLAPSLLAASACRAKKEPPPSPKEAPPTTSALASASLTPSAAAVSTCAPLEAAKIAPLATCTANVVKTPVPEIEDKSHSLAPLFDRLAEIERGAGKRPLRIGIYGDSNLTSDFLPGHLRRVLQARYGDAGHGWVSLSKPWGSYRHEDVTHAGFWPMFKLYAPTTHLVGDRQYGFANMAAQSSEIGAAAWAATTKDAKAK